MPETQLLKGVLTLLLLGVLAAQESYGYEVVLRLRRLGLGDVGEGTVYPALTRLEARGLLSSRLVASRSGPARKYYALTEQGTAELARLDDAWTAVRAAVDSLPRHPLPT
ncbi:MAG: PadR family transcriptional regulator [Kineosporiaceae bacterium]